MVSTIHIRTSQNLSPGEGSEDFGGGGLMVFKRNGEENQLLPTEYKGETTDNYQPMRENYQKTTKAEGDQADFVVTQIKSTRIILPPSPSPSPLV